MKLDFRSFLVWACARARVPKRPTEAIVLILAEGYSPPAAGAAMQPRATTDKAGEYYRRAVARLAECHWEPHELLLFEQAVEEAEMEETQRQHARALLEACRNSQDPTPRTRVYDSLGRPVGAHEPLVDLQDAERIVRRTPTKPAVYKLPVTRA